MACIVLCECQALGSCIALSFTAVVDVADLLNRFVSTAAAASSGSASLLLTVKKSTSGPGPVQSSSVRSLLTLNLNLNLNSNLHPLPSPPTVVNSLLCSVSSHIGPRLSFSRYDTNQDPAISIDQRVAADSRYPCSPRVVVYLIFISAPSASRSGSTAVPLDSAC
jgi:hypothetical protein